MRVTPLDIRQKTFEKNFRGYEKDEVNAFLLTLSQEWERIVDENKELRIKLEATEKEVTKLREVESSLYKTLKTAEDTGASVIEQARTAADLHLRESQMQAEGLLQEAKTKARNAIEESEMRVKEILAEMEDRLKTLVEHYKSLESTRDDLLINIKHLAADALERVERARAVTKEFDPDKHFSKARQESRRMAFPNVTEFDRPAKPAPPAKPELVAKPEPIAKPEPVIHREKEIILEERTITVETTQKIEAPPKKVQRSFFDEIG